MGAGFDKGTSWLITSSIHVFMKATEKSQSEIDEKFLGKVLFSFALSLIASLFTFFHRGRRSN
jgi:hypothetical protein